MDYRLEVVALPASDVDAARAFYERIGYHIIASVTSCGLYR
jgi:catechol 2,3-dioxygenase-like lactoylglutathione lyase family enzyme